MSRITKVCATCGSTKVRHDASVEWNVDRQQWEIVTVYDNADCEDCGGETALKDLPVEGIPESGVPYVINKVRGARDALQEAAKICRLSKADGHARTCEIHSAELADILPEPGMRYFAVRGRLPNFDEELPDDDDTTLLIQAMDREHAVQQFEGDMWSAAISAGLASATGIHPCVIRCVHVSDTAITES